jgi:membrane protease YdiL (CAAX protease family)
MSPLDRDERQQGCECVTIEPETNADIELTDATAAAAEPPQASALPVSMEMAEPTENPLPPLAMLATPVVVTPPRFCRTCGSPWQAFWTACEACADRARRPAPPALDIREEHHALKSAIGLYLTLLAVCAIGILCSSPSNELTVELAVIIGLSAVTLGWCIPSWPSVVPPLGKLPAPGWFAAALGMSLVTVAIAAGVISGAHRLMHVPAQRMSELFLASGYGWGMVVLCVAVQPAVIEELAFRGVIFGALQKALSPLETVMVSALMFMVLHLSVARFPHTLALGVATGYLRTRTRSLYPCVLLHFSHNFLCLAGEWMWR